MEDTKSTLKNLYEQARKQYEIYRFKQPIRKLDNVYDELCSYDNLEWVFEKAKRGKSTKAYVIEFEKKLKEKLGLQLHPDKSKILKLA